MTTYGITELGFVPKRFEVCVQELSEVIRDLFGDDVNLDAESIHGQLMNVLALREADQWERMQAAYDATRPKSATGVPLSDILDLCGLYKLPASKSQVDVLLRGPELASVPDGFQISDELETKFFETISSNAVSAASATEAVVTVTAAAAGDYTITIDGVDYTFTATTHTLAQITAGIYALLASTIYETYTITYSLVDSTVTVIPIDLSASFSVSVTGDLSLAVGSLARFYCTEAGPTSAAVDTLTKIISSPGSITSITNLVPATPGRVAETDDEARLRRQRAFAGICGATASTIENRILQEVDNVSFCRVYSNDTNNVDAAGRPGHSIEVVVIGGEKPAIASKVFETKAAGIQTFGNTSEVVEDSSGLGHEVFFSRPETVYAWLRYTITHDDEDAFPIDGVEQIQDAAVAYGTSEFSLGRDLVNHRLQVPALTIRGVRTVSLELAITATPGGTPSYEAAGDDLILTPIQQSDFDTSRVIVVEA